MKIEAGKCYRTRDGRKIGPMLLGNINNGLIDMIGSSRVWEFDGSHRKSCLQFMSGCDDLVSEWTDEPTEDKPKTWGEMSDAEKGALLLAFHNGEEVEVECTPFPAGWEPAHLTGLCRDHCSYRIKPTPKRETVTMYGGAVGFGGGGSLADDWQITFTTIDENPIPGTYTNEAGDKIVMGVIGDES